MVEKNFQVGEGLLLRVVIGACALLVIREEKIPKTMREVAVSNNSNASVLLVNNSFF